MGRTTTLRKIIESKQSGREVIYDTIVKDFNDMTDFEKKMSLRGRSNDRVCIELACRGEKLFVNEITESIIRVGRRVFKKRTSRNLIFAEGNDLKIKNQFPVPYTDFLLPMFGIEWTRDMKECLKKYLLKPVILKAVITGRIYSEETLVKRIASQVYRIKGVDWKVLREYLSRRPCYFSLYDLNEFTKDLNNTLRVIVSIINDESNPDRYQRLQLIADTLKNAVLLDRVINLRWSEKRMQQEHLKMCREIGLLTVKNKSDQPIHSLVVNEDNIRMLNSEQEVFLEGTSMSHCLYTNYYGRIEQKRYLAFHMSYPEDCTIGVRMDNEGRPCLDQAYKCRNQRCDEETYTVIKAFIERNSYEMARLMKGTEYDKKEDYEDVF